MATLLEIAELVAGSLVGATSNVAQSISISNVLPLCDADSASLTLLDNANSATALESCPAVAVIVGEKDVDAILSSCPQKQIIMIAVAHPHRAFEQAIQHVRKPLAPAASGISPLAVIGEGVSLGQDVSVGPYVTIGANCVIGDRTAIHAGTHIMSDCTIGRDCEIFSNVVLYPRTVMEDRVVLHAGTSIGAYGFGYKMVEGRHVRTAQLGWVHLESDVEVGANSAIDRGTYGATRIGCGTKIDNLVQIGHNVKVGTHNLICSQVGIAGSSTTGTMVVLGGQVGVRDHITLGDRAMVGAQSGVAADVPSDEVVIGAPAAPRKEAIQSMMAVQRLPEMRKQLKQLQRELAQLLQRSAHELSQADESAKSETKAA